EDDQRRARGNLSGDAPAERLVGGPCQRAAEPGPYERDRRPGAGGVAEAHAPAQRRPGPGGRLLGERLARLLVDLPVLPPADRDLLVLANVDRADQRLALDHAERHRLGRLRVVGARRRRAPTLVGGFRILAGLGPPRALGVALAGVLLG